MDTMRGLALVRGFDLVDQVYIYVNIYIYVYR